MNEAQAWERRSFGPLLKILKYGGDFSFDIFPYGNIYSGHGKSGNYFGCL